MNVFEGARRLAMVCAAAGLCAGIALAVNERPSVTRTYMIPGYEGKAQSWAACSADDGIAISERTLDSGESFLLRACFHSSQAENGEQMIPYAPAERNDMVLLGPSYTRVVRDYMQKVADNIELTPYQERNVREDYAMQRWERPAKVMVGTVIALALFWGGVWLIGWVVRGFTGIPRGMDHRPAVSSPVP